MTDKTPRTDFIVANYRPYAGSSQAETGFDRMSYVSRQLERELSAAKAETAAAVRKCEEFALGMVEQAANHSDPCYYQKRANPIRAAFKEYFNE